MKNIKPMKDVLYIVVHCTATKLHKKARDDIIVIPFLLLISWGL